MSPTKAPTRLNGHESIPKGAEMKLDNVKARLKEPTPDGLTMTAREIGHELSRCDLHKLSMLRVHLAKAYSGEVDGYTEGYLRALAEVVNAFEREIEAPGLQAEIVWHRRV